MRILLWLLRGIVFIALFGLAVKNSGPVDLRFYLDGVWQAPLSLVLLTAFAIGAAVGLTATVVTLVRQGREIKRLRIRAQDNSAAAEAGGQSGGDVRP